MRFLVFLTAIILAAVFILPEAESRTLRLKRRALQGADLERHGGGGGGHYGGGHYEGGHHDGNHHDYPKPTAAPVTKAPTAAPTKKDLLADLIDKIKQKLKL